MNEVQQLAIDPRFLQSLVVAITMGLAWLAQRG
jgi:hypothetical protein